MAVIQFGIDQRLRPGPGAALIVGPDPMGPAAARGQEVGHAELLPLLKLGAVLGVIFDFFGQRRAGVPVAGAEGQEPAAGPESADAGPADKTPIAGVFFGLID
ncbi:MAG: hypothetical protein BWY71_01879 [Planctomycetes bacterium ADurb.Bin412]|nr:MAG: hypothetical protein BWY71_01879 [Planctomycetes bacterium ADurb.Bin412]